MRHLAAQRHLAEWAQHWWCHKSKKRKFLSLG